MFVIYEERILLCKNFKKRWEESKINSKFMRNEKSFKKGILV